MKLSQLIADYLYSHKQLSLQGIGTFLLDTSYQPVPDSKQETKDQIPGVISFEKNNSVQTDPELIDFIAGQTGKMKALASSDLDSHLEQARQFINIGKPFLFEGIGTLAKNKDSQYEFTQGNSFVERIKNKRLAADVNEGEEQLDYKSIFLKDPKKINWRKPILALLMLTGLAIVIGGGYWLYKKTSENKTETIQNEETEQVNNETQQSVNRDTSKAKQDTAMLNVQPGPQITRVNDSLPLTYKFVLDNFKAPRAFKRFEQLKSNGWSIQMETKDSVTYKLFVLRTIRPADTTRVLDTLTTFNGRRVYIEHTN